MCHTETRTLQVHNKASTMQRKLLLEFCILASSLVLVRATDNKINVTKEEKAEDEVERVALGKTVVLKCRSNDENHNFRFWQLPQTGNVIGPGNDGFDSYKYKYEILSGKLYIRDVSKAEEGLYHCISEGVRNIDVNVRSVRMIVEQEDTSGVNYFKGVVIVTCFVVVGGLVYLIQRMRKKKRFQSLMEDEEDESGEEIFSAPGTSRRSGNIVKNSEDQEALVEVEIPQISIDLDDDLIGIRNK